MNFKEQFQEFINKDDYKSAANLLYEYGGYFVCTKEDLKQLACSKIIEEDFKLAKHILDNLYNNPECKYWKYDTSLGVLETPTPITDTQTIIEVYEGTI